MRLLIDDELLDGAGQILGTTSPGETIERALREVVAVEARRRIIERMRSQRGLDLADPDVMRSAWRQSLLDAESTRTD